MSQSHRSPQPALAGPRPASALLGRAFVDPTLEYLLVGGGLSLLATAILYFMPHRPAATTGLALATLLLATNSAHFASSTVRLYSKPGSYQSWPRFDDGLSIGGAPGSRPLASLIRCSSAAICSRSISRGRRTTTPRRRTAWPSCTHIGPAAE
jgi:hypothetical protein